MNWEVPVIDADELVGVVIRTIEIINSDGEVVATRRKDTFDYLTRERKIDAINARANFMLWNNRQCANMIAHMRGWGEYRPGYWRGQPNKYSATAIKSEFCANRNCMRKRAGFSAWCLDHSPNRK